LLIVAGGYEAEALSVIITARINQRLPVVAIRMEHYGERKRETLRDVAALTGGKAFTEDLGVKIEDVKLAQLGLARKVVVDMAKTQIVDGRGKQEELIGRLNMIRTAMETVAPAEKSILRRRLSSLQGGITVIKVGGVTVTEMEEKRDRVIDALSAAKAAISEGVVSGGGTALLQARTTIAAHRYLQLQAEIPGYEVVNEACYAVAGQIIENAGLSRDEILPYLTATPNIGFNAMNGEYEDLFESGILDPVKVVIESLKNAAAVACSILTMGATVAEVLTQEKTNA
jgi:chaperonin GroEL